jgi:hypothetical protein
MTPADRPNDGDQPKGLPAMSEPISKSLHRAPALIFELDGTLVDRVYQHVLT